uniref:Uncharacterized protein n=1 Tax=Anopheles maculatus TaxID=74869 RepID=A0A182TA65_9DIPT
MYASSSSNCFTGINNFQELRFITPSNKNGSLAEELETKAHSTTASSLTTHVALHFTSTTTSTTATSTSSIHNEIPDTFKQPAKIDTMDGSTVVPRQQCNGTQGVPVPFELPKSPEQFDCFAPSTKEQPVPDPVPSAKLAKATRKDNVRGCSVSFPTEELLGSVTTFYPSGDLENGQTLRTSARVKHKMRMDSIRSSTPPLTERK